MNFSPYPNPYGGRAGPYLSATQGFLNSYVQMRQMLQKEQYYRSLMDLRQSSAEREQRRLGFEERRLKLAEQGGIQTPGKKISRLKLETLERLEQPGYEPTMQDKALFSSLQEKKPFTPGRIEQTLGELESGGSATIFGTVIPFMSGESAVQHAQRKLGPDWQEIAPGAAEIIQRKWPDTEIAKRQFLKSTRKVRMANPKGEEFDVEEWEVPEAEKHGWSVVR